MFEHLFPGNEGLLDQLAHRAGVDRLDDTRDRQSSSGSGKIALLCNLPVC